MSLAFLLRTLGITGFPAKISAINSFIVLGVLARL